MRSPASFLLLLSLAFVACRPGGGNDVPPGDDVDPPNGGTTSGGGTSGGGTSGGGTSAGGTSAGGSTRGDTTPTADGGAPGACVPGGRVAPLAWTCDPDRYGDCACDCDCGPEMDVDCKVGQCATCEHDVCAAGAPLGLSCTKDGVGGACIRAVCDVDPYCCTKSWGASCVDKVKAGVPGCAPRACP